MASTPRSELLPVLPMDDVVVLPHMTVTLAVDGDSQQAAIEAARQGSRLILLVPAHRRASSAASAPSPAWATPPSSRPAPRRSSSAASTAPGWAAARPTSAAPCGSRPTRCRSPSPRPSRRIELGARVPRHAREPGRVARRAAGRPVPARGARPRPPRRPGRLLARPDASSRSCEVLETVDVEERLDQAHRLDQADPRRRFAQGEDPQRRHRGHGEDAARVPAAPAAGGHQEAAERGQHRRRLDLPRARRQGRACRRTCARR